MPIAQLFDPSKGMIFVVWKGKVTAQEWFEKAQRLVSNPAWESTPRLLADLQSVMDTATIREAEIDQAVQIFSANPNALSGKRIAILAQDAFAKARYFSRIVARYSVTCVVFNTLDTACLFLGIDVDYAYATLLSLRNELDGT